MRGTGIEIEVVKDENECWETRKDFRRPLPCSEKQEVFAKSMLERVAVKT